METKAVNPAIARIMGIQKEIKREAKDGTGIEHMIQRLTQEQDDKENLPAKPKNIVEKVQKKDELPEVQKTVEPKKEEIKKPTQQPASPLMDLIGKPVIVVLKVGVEYRGILKTCDAQMNLKLLEVQEWKDGKMTAEFGNTEIKKEEMLSMRVEISKKIV